MGFTTFYIVKIHVNVEKKLKFHFLLIKFHLNSFWHALTYKASRWQRLEVKKMKKGAIKRKRKSFSVLSHYEFHKLFCYLLIFWHSSSKFRESFNTQELFSDVASQDIQSVNCRLKYLSYKLFHNSFHEKFSVKFSLYKSH